VVLVIPFGVPLDGGASTVTVLVTVDQQDGA
jgi:hypothetical protein